MLIDVVSDLHIELNQNWCNNPNYDGISSIYPWHLESKSDVLIIAGDNSNDPLLSMKVTEEASQFYKYVIWTDGNHEHYRNTKTKSTVADDNTLFDKQSKDIGNITFLNSGRNDIQINDTLFIGANNWYDWTANSMYSRTMQLTFWKDNMNDSKTIRFNEHSFPDKMARKQSERLRERVTSAQHDDGVKDIVVVTHTIPERSLAIPDNHSFGYLNGSYVNMLAQQIALADKFGKIKAWIYGHTHFNEDRVIDGIRYVNNARGYYAYNKLQRENKFSGIKQIDLSEVMTRSAFGEIV